MAANKPTKFWVSRDEDHCLVLWRNSPRNRDGNFVDHREVSDALGDLSVDLWPFFGLQKEPKKGTCFEITWKERTFDLHKEHSVTLWVPTVREVTEELKEVGNA